MSVMRVPHQTDFSQSYSQHSLHRSVSQLIDRKSLMMEEGSWDNPLGQDSGLVRTEKAYILNPYETNAVRVDDLYIDKKHWCLYCEVKRSFEGDPAPRPLFILPCVAWSLVIVAKLQVSDSPSFLLLTALCDVLSSLSVCGGRWVCGHYKSLKFCEKRAHHVHRYSPLTSWDPNFFWGMHFWFGISMTWWI